MAIAPRWSHCQVSLASSLTLVQNTLISPQTLTRVVSTRPFGARPLSCVAQTAMSTVPTWEDIQRENPDLMAHKVALVSQTNERLFGNTDAKPLKLYRDNSSWCPYCERVWLQLEEKKIPYIVEKINMRCYGPKPDWFTRMVPSGLLPVLELDGKVVTESMDIMFLLEQHYPEHTPLLPPPSHPSFSLLGPLLRLERQLFSSWLQWLVRPGPWGGSQGGFESTMDDTNKALLQSGGPYFLGKEFSMIDAVFAPFLERIAASIPYWKGLQVRGNPRWPAVNAWFDAMDSRPSYKAIKSDDFGITHNLEPQVGRAASERAGADYRALVDGTNGSWDLPLKPETTAWGYDDGTSGQMEAAAAMVGNHSALLSFSLRSAATSKMQVDDELRDEVDRAMRVVAGALVKGVGETGNVLSSLRQSERVQDALMYLRDRVGVPRDMTYPAARQLRAHLHWMVKQLQQ